MEWSPGEALAPLPVRGAGSRGARARWRRALARHVPAVRWAPRYGREAALADLVAGLTLGLTLVPQSIAYAALADLPVQYGLYSAFVGTIVYVFLGTVKEVSIGPTSLMALLTLQICHGLPMPFVTLLTLLSGLIVLAMGLLRLGFLVKFISPSVTSGFTTATAIIIVVSQIKGLLGLSFVAESVPQNVAALVTHLAETRVPDAALAAGCCGALLLLRKLKDVRVSGKRRWVRGALWLASIGRNALVVAAASALAYCSQRPHHEPLFRLSGAVEPGLPPIRLPPLSAQLPNNQTVSLPAMVSRLGGGLLLVPVVMVLANIAIAKAFARGRRVDATQEMVTLGLCNVLGSLVGAMPTCGAFTRSAVSHASGVATPLAGLYSGIVTLLALAFMTQYFYYIPKACLSSVLICAVIFMVDVSTIRRLWRGGKSLRGELVTLLGTVAVSLCASVELALLCGAAGSLARLLRHAMAPPLHAHTYQSACGAVAVVRPSLWLVYLNAERASRAVERAAATVAPRPALLDCGDLARVDDAAAQAVCRVRAALSARGQALVVYNARPQAARALRAAGLPAHTLALRTISEALAAATAATAATDHLTTPLLTPPPTAVSPDHTDADHFVDRDGDDCPPTPELRV